MGMSLTSRLAKDRYSCLISPKEVDIILDPLKGQTLVVERGICSSVRLKGGTTKPTKSAQLWNVR